MTINRKHIDRVFSKRLSLLDLKMLEKYFEDEKLNEEARLVNNCYASGSCSG